MIIERLREATADSHQQLEEKLFPFIKTINSHKEYGKLLNAFYGYIFPVQERIAAHIDHNIVPDMDQRRNAALITGDLLTISIKPDHQFAVDLPAIDDHASAIGALYVLEGSTLGGKIISKTISERLGKTEGFSFFRGYGAETGPRWKKFTQYLEHDQHIPDAEIIANSAVKTFTLFGTWFDKSL
jgi:heme oxygenase (biliverdin-IX-beta and delta-forming)